MAGNVAAIAELVGTNEEIILAEWVELLKKAGSLQTGRITEAELFSQSREFLHLLRDGLTRSPNYRRQLSNCGMVYLHCP